MFGFVASKLEFEQNTFNHHLEFHLLECLYSMFYDITSYDFSICVIEAI